MRTADMMAVGGVEAKRASEAFKSRTRAEWQNDRGHSPGPLTVSDRRAHIKTCSAPLLGPSPRVRTALPSPRPLTLAADCSTSPSTARSPDTTMSDHETGGMPSDEDLSLPKATVTKMISGAFASESGRVQSIHLHAAPRSFGLGLA